MKSLRSCFNPMAGPNASYSGRFVILWHDVENLSGRQNHYDFLLESAGFFVTLELSDLPWQGTKVEAKVLPPHRLDYWELEGPISGNRGCVTRITRGDYQLIATSKGQWEIPLCSAEIKTVLKINSETSDEFSQWTPETKLSISVAMP